MPLSSEHFNPELTILNKNPDKYSPTLHGSSGDETSVRTAPSSNLSSKDTMNHAPLTLDSSATAAQRKDVPLPHNAIWSQANSDQSLISWWTELYNFSMIENYTPGVSEYIAGDDRPRAEKRQASLLGRFAKGFAGLFHAQDATSQEANKYSNMGTRVARSNVPTLPVSSDIESDTLFHIVLTISHFKKDLNLTVHAACIRGTYTSFAAAKAFAYRCLFDAGYKQEWFISFISQKWSGFVNRDDTAIVRAIGPNGEIFIVSVGSSSNLFNLKPNFTGRVETPLHHVVRTVVYYHDGGNGPTRETSVQASFLGHDEARNFALTSVTCKEDRFTNGNYIKYDQARPGDVEYTHDENVYVHARTGSGESFVVSIVKGHEMESARVMNSATKTP